MNTEHGGPSPQDMEIKKVDKESYDFSGVLKVLEALKKSPKKLEMFIKQAMGRAEDIFESGGLENEFNPGDTVLYIGAGTGHVIKNIEEKTGAKAIKMDLMDLRTEDTKDKNFARANARHLPFQDAKADVICLFDILHHTQNQEEILAEVKRVLKPGGKCLILEDTLPEKFEKSRKIMETLVAKTDDLFNQQAKGVNPHNYKSISDWEVFLKESGLEVDASDTKSWYWGAPDFVGADRSKRPNQRTLARPFESTLLKVFKPTEAK